MGFEYRHGPVSRLLHDRGWKGAAYFLNKLTGWGHRGGSDGSAGSASYAQIQKRDARMEEGLDSRRRISGRADGQVDYRNALRPITRGPISRHLRDAGWHKTADAAEAFGFGKRRRKKHR